MARVFRGIADTLDGGITLVQNVPRQVWEVYKILPPYEKSLIHKKLGLGQALGEAQQDTLKRAAPFIALGIIAVVAYNIHRDLK